MNKLNFKINKQSGQFLASYRMIKKLPEGLKEPSNDFALIEVLLVKQPEEGQTDSTVCYLDFEDFKKVLGCNKFEFDFFLRNWMALIGLNDGEWVRLDISVFEETKIK